VRRGEKVHRLRVLVVSGVGVNQREVVGERAEIGYFERHILVDLALYAEAPAVLFGVLPVIVDKGLAPANARHQPKLIAQRYVESRAVGAYGERVVQDG